MSNIFINYRRGDDPGFTQALYGRLESAFSPERLFMDVDNIAPGLDFVQALSDQVAQCDVLIVVIGKGWLQATDETGERRLDNESDFVRIEIESALQQNKRVIPVLVNDARMPRAADLPESLAPLARCNAVRLTHERFRADTQGLIKSLERVLEETHRERMRLEEERAWKLQERAAKDRKRRQAPAQKAVAEKEPRETRKGPVKSAAGPEEAKPAPAGIVGAIAALPSNAGWHVPAILIAIYLLGWFIPGQIFNEPGIGWGLVSSVYSIVGLLATIVAAYVWRSKLSGPELALAWYAVFSFLALAGLSAQMGWALSVNADGWVVWAAVAAAAWLIWLRRSRVGGLEASVYWVGLVLMLFWGIVPWLASLGALQELDAAVFGSGSGFRAAAAVLAAALAVATMAIIVWRLSWLSRQELAVYGLGLAYLGLAAGLLK